MMDIQQLWLDRFNKMRENLASINNWLIILNLTVLLTFSQQYFEIRKQENILSQTDKVLSYPWDKLQLWYEGTNGNINQYYENRAVKWLQLCMSTSLLSTFKNGMAKTDKNNPSILKTIRETSYAAKAIGAYSDDLLHVLAAQKSLKHFNELDKNTLISLINISQSDDKKKIDSIREGTAEAVKFGKIMLLADSQSIKTSRPLGFSPTLIAILQFANSKDEFSTLSTDMMVSNYWTFAAKALPNDTTNKIKAYLIKYPFNNRAYYINRKNACIEKIEDLRTGKFFELPLLNVEITLLEFVIISGLINLVIILYIDNIWKKLKMYWQFYSNTGASPITADEKSASWYEVTFAVNNKNRFIIFNSLFLSFIGVFGQALGIILFKYSGWPLLMSTAVAAVSVFYTFRFYRIYSSV